MLPLWEAGAGIAAISFPDYRGAAGRHGYLLPVPVFVYRGDIFQIDREKVRGLLFKSKCTELDISINGSVPIHSDGNPVREEMPDLDPTIELGPSLNVSLAKTDRATLVLRLPLRAVIASNFRSIHGAGALANPNFNLDLKAQRWRLGLVAGVLFADQSIMIIFMGWHPSMRGRADRLIAHREVIQAHSLLRRFHGASSRYGWRGSSSTMSSIARHSRRSSTMNDTTRCVRHCSVAKSIRRVGV